MNGHGWKCDNCGDSIVLPENRWSTNNEPFMPQGWFVLAGPMQPDVAAMTEARHLCSRACVLAAAVAVAGGRPDSHERPIA